MRKLLPIFLLSLSVLLLSQTPARADYDRADNIKEPYHALDFVLDAKDHKDLQGYLQKALEALKKTRKEAKRLSDVKLHDRLVSGAKEAIAQSEYKFEFVFFRHILQRALDMDDLYLSGSLVLNPEKLAERYDAANLNLNLSIRVAMEYYTIGINELSKEVIQVPDWIRFALDMIPLLQTETTLAPTAYSQKEVCYRALGWTGRGINSSIERRTEQVAQSLEDLEEAQQKLVKNEFTVEQAQQVLLEVAKRLKTLPRHTASESTPSSAPKEAYPTVSPIAQESKTTNSHSDKVGPGVLPWGPLVETEMGGNIGWANTDAGSLSMSIGYGAIVEYESGETTKAFSQLEARATLLLNQLHSWGRDDWSHGLMVGMASQYIDVKARIAPDSSPIFRIKATAGAQIVPGVGVWAAIEANYYKTISDQIVRAGWGPMLSFRMDGINYVLVHGGLGTNAMQVQNGQVVVSYDENGAATVNQGEVSSAMADGLSAELALLIKYKGFVISVEGNIDNPPIKGEVPGRPQRMKIASEVTIPLGLIFGNDALKVEGEATNYSFGSEAYRDQNIYEGGVSYVVQW